MKSSAGCFPSGSADLRVKNRLACEHPLRSTARAAAGRHAWRGGGAGATRCGRRRGARPLRGRTTHGWRRLVGAAQRAPRVPHGLSADGGEPETRGGATCYGQVALMYLTAPLRKYIWLNDWVGAKEERNQHVCTR